MHRDDLQEVLESTLPWLIEESLAPEINSRKARRERFMCAIIAASGMDCASLDANVGSIAAQAEIFLRASDALDAGEVKS